MLLIDQHALHERIRYERLRNDESLWLPQPRLVATRIQLTLAQEAHLASSLQRFEELGFKLEKQGEGEWDVTQAPRLLDGDELEPFLFDLLQDLSEEGAPLETIERRKDHLAFLNACRGSVKANDTLTIAQMRRLLEDMRNVPNPWACVHGRPTALRLSLDSLTSTSVGMVESRSMKRGSATRCSLGPSIVAPVCVARRWLSFGCDDLQMFR